MMVMTMLSPWQLLPRRRNVCCCRSTVSPGRQVRE